MVTVTNTQTKVHPHFTSVYNGNALVGDKVNLQIWGGKKPTSKSIEKKKQKKDSVLLMLYGFET